MTAPLRRVEPEALTAAAFAPFGDVIASDTAREVMQINDGHTERYHDLARLDLTGQSGTPLVSIFRSTPLAAPIVVTTLECHPLSSQAFYPLSGRPYLVVVAPPGEFDPGAVRVFRAGPHQGVNYAAGTWHHYSLALEAVSDFLVIDRGGPEDNCRTVDLAPADRFAIVPGPA